MALGVDHATYHNPMWRAAHLVEYEKWKLRSRVAGKPGTRKHVLGWRLLDESGTRIELMWETGAFETRKATEPFPLHICREIEWPPGDAIAGTDE